jgi:hypothetical protein
MGYLHINNLYKDDRIFKFDECYALEKIHGTSAHIKYKPDETDGNLIFFSGGESTEKFIALFDREKLTMILHNVFIGKEIIIYGEAYGGKQQGMSATYGKELKFVVFDVRIDGIWQNVPEAYRIASMLGLEFVDYTRISTKLTDIDAERAKPSAQARRNGITEPKEREGIVLRPLEETVDHRGHRIITKHKNDSFKETKTQREVDPERLKVLADANQIADEWVTENRMDHVLQQAASDNENAFHEGGYRPLDITDTGSIVKMMVEDVKREAKGEILESKDAIKAIGAATARMFKKRLATQFSQQEK